MTSATHAAAPTITPVDADATAAAANDSLKNEVRYDLDHQMLLLQQVLQLMLRQYSSCCQRLVEK
jgi:hypothetical protein